MKYNFKKETVLILLAVTSAAALLRLVIALQDWIEGVSTQLEAYSFTVVFPLLLLVVLALMAGTHTKEGLLMRFGTMLQLLLIILLPSYSLYLALGLPVVFLIVEVYETRVPDIVKAPLERLIIK